MAAPGERHTVVDAQRLEDTVADREAVIERRDTRLFDGEQRAVEPDDHRTPTSTRVPDAAASRRRTLISVSAHSASARESATMPPPTPRYVAPPAIVNVR